MLSQRCTPPHSVSSCSVAGPRNFSWEPERPPGSSANAASGADGGGCKAPSPPCPQSLGHEDGLQPPAPRLLPGWFGAPVGMRFPRVGDAVAQSHGWLLRTSHGRACWAAPEPNFIVSHGHSPSLGGVPCCPMSRQKNWCHHGSPVHAGSSVPGRRGAQLDGFLFWFFFFSLKHCNICFTL